MREPVSCARVRVRARGVHWLPHHWLARRLAQDVQHLVPPGKLDVVERQLDADHQRDVGQPISRLGARDARRKAARRMRAKRR